MLMAAAMVGENIDTLMTALRQNRSVNVKNWSDETLRQDTIEQCQRALRLGLENLRDISGFLVLRHTVGARFDELPAVKRHLRESQFPPGLRIHGLMLSLPLAYWGAAKRVCATRLNKPENS